MQATGMYFSQPDWELFETFNRVSRIYEKFGCPDEWQVADQGSVIAYKTNEVPIVPRSEFRLAQRMPVFWHPSVGPALVADTILVGESEFELLTPAGDWPRVKVEVKGAPIFRPDILRRDED
jgi:Xaa-Pro dipeptidase